MLSRRTSRLKPSPTLAITGRVRALRDAGENIISFGAGEPDFDTPETIKEAAIEAIRKGFTKYTPSPGIPELREAIADKHRKDNKFAVEAANVVVSTGAKQAIYNAVMTLCNPGDEIIVIAPYWMTYVEQIELAEGVCVVVQTTLENCYEPDYETLKAAVTPKTKAIIINSPSNPSGAVYSRKTLKEIAAIALKNKLWVISDEIYEKHVYDGHEHFSIASLGEDIAARTITINGLSKAFAMTGWRIGWSCAPREITAAISALQDQVTSNATSISQYAALAALNMAPGEVAKMIQEFDCRRSLIMEQMSEIVGVKFAIPRGAFYLFADFSHLLQGEITSDLELATFLLNESKVACVPGSVFGGDGHLRFTYALSREQICEGVSRISEGIKKLNP